MSLKIIDLDQQSILAGRRQKEDFTYGMQVELDTLREHFQSHH